MKPFTRKYTDEQLQQFHTAIDDGLTTMEAADIAGMNRKTAITYGARYRKTKRTPRRKRAKAKSTAKSTATTQPKPSPRVQVESPITSADVDAIRYCLDEILLAQRQIVEILQHGIRLAPAPLPAQPSTNGTTAPKPTIPARTKKVNTDNVKLNFFAEDPTDMELTPDLRRLIPEAAECYASGYKNAEIVQELSPDITAEQLKFLKTTAEFKQAVEEVKRL